MACIIFVRVMSNCPVRSGARIFQSLTVGANEGVTQQGHVQHSQGGSVICSKSPGYKVLLLEGIRRYYLPGRPVAGPVPQTVLRAGAVRPDRLKRVISPVADLESGRFSLPFSDGHQ